MIHKTRKALELYLALKGYDGKTLDMAMSDIEKVMDQTEIGNKIQYRKDLITKIQSIITKMTQITQLEENLKTENDKLSTELNGLTDSITEKKWDYLLFHAKTHFQKPKTMEEFYICLIRAYFEGNFKLYESSIRCWKDDYNADPYPILNLLVSQEILAKEPLYSCPNCDEAQYLTFKTNLEIGYCMHCDTASDVKDLQPEYTYYQGKNYQTWLQSNGMEKNVR